MKHEIPFRINVSRPLPAVAMRVQRGRGELLEPIEATASAISFEFSITVDVSDAGLNFLGKYAQGPKGQRFVYVNSGTYAGQIDTCWSRRAKLSLVSITSEQIEEVLERPGSRIETTMPGVGRDGGPTCASVKGITWRVAKR